MSNGLLPAEAEGAAPDAVISLRPALLRLDARLQQTVGRSRQELSRRAQDPFRGLCITEADVDELLATPSSLTIPDQERLPSSRGETRLGRLTRWYGLDAFEQEALLICLAPDLDLRYERLYAYLQDDVTRRRPNVDLILRLLAPRWEERIRLRPALGPSGRLLGHGLLALGDENAGRLPLLARPLRVDDRIADYLLGADAPDARLVACIDLVPPDRTEQTRAATPPEERLASLLGEAPRGTSPARVLYLQAAGVAKLAFLRSACRIAARPLLSVEIATVLATGNAMALLPLIVREATLQEAALCFGGFDALLGGDSEAATVGALLRRQVAVCPFPVVLLGETRWEPATWWPERNALRIELPSEDLATRRQIWQRRLAGILDSPELTDLAGRYRLDELGVAAVLTAAQGRAAARGSDGPGRNDIRAAARLIAAPPLNGLAHRIEARYGWADIVLPADGLAQLHELHDRVQYRAAILEDWGFGKKHLRRRGLVALFAGPPGTGKTMAAEVLSHQLDLDLYRIDLSSVVSKYIGETEKNLDQIFRAADQGDAVLLFDEADALFGKRSEVRDAHDRYANVETAYLLQRLEGYDGLAVLTTNMRGNIDEAFLRRLDCVLEFNLPEEAERLTIWRRSLPEEAPLAADVDLAFLARKFKLAGGHIHNIAATAAFLAVAEHEPITMHHLIRAVRREYQKLGKLVAEADFGQYFAVLKEATEAPAAGGPSRLGMVK